MWGESGKSVFLGTELSLTSHLHPDIGERSVFAQRRGGKIDGGERKKKHARKLILRKFHGKFNKPIRAIDVGGNFH